MEITLSEQEVDSLLTILAVAWPVYGIYAGPELTTATNTLSIAAYGELLIT